MPAINKPKNCQICFSSLYLITSFNHFAHSVSSDSSKPLILPHQLWNIALVSALLDILQPTKLIPFLLRKSIHLFASAISNPPLPDASHRLPGQEYLDSDYLTSVWIENTVAGSEEPFTSIGGMVYGDAGNAEKLGWTENKWREPGSKYI